MSGDMRMRTVRGATRQNQRLPIARRMGWDVFCSFSLAVGITSKNTMMAIVQAFCLLVFSWTHRLAVEPSDLEHHRLPGAYQL